MRFKFLFFLIFLTFYKVASQNALLPEGLRQHTLTQYNSSLQNPAFSLDRNNPESVSLWNRWQWQNVDTDPSTLFLNYSRKFSEDTAVGLGFFQHNTGVYFNTGWIINYAFKLQFNKDVKLAFGANVSGFRQELADDSLFGTSRLSLEQVEGIDDLILQISPGINLSIKDFSFSLGIDNILDYNISDGERNDSGVERSVFSTVSYDLPLVASDSTAFLRPSIYVRTIPDMDTQLGANLLFSTKKYWAQAGYNDFYGASVGVGATVFNRFSLGVLAEFGIEDEITSDPSYEIVASYFLGSTDKRRKAVPFVAEEEEVLLTAEEEKKEEQAEEEFKEWLSEKDKEKEAKEAQEEQEEILEKELDKQKAKEAKKLAAAEKQKRKDALAEAKKEKSALAIAEKDAAKEEKINKKRLKEEAVLAEKDKIEKERLDAIKASEMEAITRKKETEALAEKKRADELAAKQAAVKVEVQAGEKYQEITNEDILEPGFYLIVNVFGTKKYFDAFMNELRKKGVNPKSFYRSKNKYNYAYLERYDTIEEARRARDSQFNGKYQDDIWILRIK